MNKFVFSLATMTLALCSVQGANTNEERVISYQMATPRTSASVPYRTLTFIDTRGASVNFNDNSIWLIDSNSSRTSVQNWNLGDKVVVYPTLSPFWSGTKFYLYNENKRTYAYAEYSRGPISQTPFCIEITHIDLERRELIVVDGRGQSNVWRVALADVEKLQNWAPGQALMYGFYEDCIAGWFSEYSYILINVEKNEYVRASL